MSATFNVQTFDLFETIVRRKALLLSVFFSIFILVSSLAFVLPKTYRSQGVIHIGVNYFQNPLIQDMVATTFDPVELKAQREGLLRKSLNSDFVAKTGPLVGYLPTDADAFLRNVEISPVTSTQFKITFKANTPQKAQTVVSEAIKAITETMYNERLQTVRELRETMIEQSNREKSKTAKSYETDIQNEFIRRTQRLSVALELETNDPSMSGFLSVIEPPSMPATHEFPKLKTFLIFGIVTASMISTLATVIIELRRRLDITPEYAAQTLNVPLLGVVHISIAEELRKLWEVDLT